MVTNVQTPWAEELRRVIEVRPGPLQAGGTPRAALTKNNLQAEFC